MQLKGTLFCPNARRVKLYDNFYVPTMVSAMIHNNTPCIREVCGEQALYFRVSEARELGGTILKKQF